jgi:hypothetical protein
MANGSPSDASLGKSTSSGFSFPCMKPPCSSTQNWGDYFLGIT